MMGEEILPSAGAAGLEASSMPNENLLTYLGDHLAASVAAVEMLGSLKAAANEKHAAEIEALLGEIEMDREALRKILRRAGGEESAIKKAGAWAAEKVALMKFKYHDLGKGSLGEFEALEMLSLGIAGKAGLWKALSVIGLGAAAWPSAEPNAGAEAEAGEVPDLQTLLWRAERQREIVETWRIAKAREIFC